ncbi:hypothetical protein [Halopseudomonas sp.]|uniref:hypothetical protein n=1 Tax=Halopseudomonas sp. TaxID=2901191 RepID=UPI0035641FAA
MNIKQLGAALESGEVVDVNIITHSGLNRYAVQVVMGGAEPRTLVDNRRQPRFWSSLAQVQASLRRHRIAPPALRVIVAQDEVIGR